MAFKMQLTDKTGCTRPEAYAKVCFYAFDENAKQGRIVLEVYNSKADRDAGKLPVQNEQIEVLINAASEGAAKDFDKVLSSVEEHGPKKVAYVLAKKLAQLQNAEDILEDGQASLTDSDVGLS